MATIKDVARQAHVSTATVSYVLNGTGTVTAETRRRVLEAVASLNYRPNYAARSMRSRARTLGLVLPNGAAGLGDPALAELVAGIVEAAASDGYCLLLAASDERTEHEYGADLAHTGRVDGLLLLNLQQQDERAAYLCAAGVPCVGAGVPVPAQAYPSVGLDLTHAATEATRHLLSLGCRQIAMISLPSGLADSEPFYQGFATSLAAAGMPGDPSMVIEAGLSHDAGIAAMQELLARPEPPDAILAASDTLAFGAMHALREAGIAIGTQMALVGCGDLPLAAHTHPPLTTLRAPRHAHGAALAHRLIALIEQRPTTPEMLIRLQLIIRHSTVAPRSVF